MKTTIDLPEPLYKRAKIRAVEKGQTLKQLILEALLQVLDAPARTEEGASFFARRRLLPEYEAALKAGTYTNGTDSSSIVSEGRSSRENTLL